MRVGELAWYERVAAWPLARGEAYVRAKRVVDVTVSLLLLGPAMVVLLVCAVAVKLESPGPALFCQERTGRHGRRFKMYKLRTMVSNAELLKERYAHLNVLRPPDFKIPHDPRLTRVGRWLRKTSLDELPQIFNVLRGEMSLVGPRPTSFAPETYHPRQWERLAAKPGLTGLWQVSGRADLDFDERCRLDATYVRHQCLALDLAIMLRTLSAVYSGRGAE
jgi:lipopolysaccharide/colanic/teichoic acid biosynthesis glycosyltransferase